MPTARETLLEAAHAAVSARPWAGVRMIEVAERAGVSRQTLYNEFGSKEGLGIALVRHRVERFLRGAVTASGQAARKSGDPAACCVAAAAWLLRTARADPIVRAALTGCWGTRMPLSVRDRPGEPGELAAELRDRLVAAMTERPGLPGTRDPEVLRRACEAGLRLALSYVVAPAPGAEEEACHRIHQVVRALLDPVPEERAFPRGAEGVPAGPGRADRVPRPGPAPGGRPVDRAGG
ncbi:TetR/AcrR family transcriptional regulator [Streptomyces sp. JJ36]|uniref:TetR/AcrR family transcriptional regulator n=1 Tax=Streptomyces sp. JJ36 TaxID=2736645 RepID=UPI0027955760|nr:TetR/AcrR family transcriptional regulator [Streptomyces sp. JJ36]MCF6523456.1 TetR/AcrR family transcriptional regulator [Streptomyces sp. JJ36]